MGDQLDVTSSPTLCVLQSVPAVLSEMSDFSQHMDDEDDSKLAQQPQLWEALQSHYNYLMNDELIETCKEANGELGLQSKSVSSVWSFKEFLEQYAELSTWLAKVEDLCRTLDDKDQIQFKAYLDEMPACAIRCKQFTEQAQQLCGQYPNLKDEIQRRVSHVSECWKQIDTRTGSQGDTRLSVRHDIEYQLRCLRRWLRNVETRLRSCSILPGWTADDLRAKLQEQQSLQREIESRGKSVTAVLKLCEQLRNAEQRADESGNNKQWNVLFTGHLLTRVAHNVERHWHTVWLRSLEWQCWLEDALLKLQQNVPSSYSDSSFGDEPVKKFPRLSESYNGGRLPNHQLNVDTDDPPEFYVDAEDLDKMILDEEYYDCHSAAEINSNTRDVGTNYEPHIQPEQVCKRQLKFDRQQLNSEQKKRGVEDDLAQNHITGVVKLQEMAQDVGYSSESSAHFSNDEPNDCVRVYSYTSGNTSSPRILDELVIDHRDRKLHQKAEPWQTKSLDQVVPIASPNCATYYFKHEDTDPESALNDDKLLHSTPKHRSHNEDLATVPSSLKTDDSGELTLLNVSKILNLSPEREVSPGNELTCTRFQDGPTSLSDSELDDRYDKVTSVAYLDSDTLTKKKKKKKKKLCRPDVSRTDGDEIDSSCDASGEYTSDSDTSGPEVISAEEESSACSVLKQSTSSTIPALLNFINTDDYCSIDRNKSGSKVTLRRKKRRSQDRPWSVVEVPPRDRLLRKGLTISSSETALNLINSEVSKRLPCSQSAGCLNTKFVPSRDNGDISCSDNSAQRRKCKSSSNSNATDSGSESTPSMVTAPSTIHPSGLSYSGTGSDSNQPFAKSKSPSRRRHRSSRSGTQLSGNESASQQCIAVKGKGIDVSAILASLRTTIYPSKSATPYFKITDTVTSDDSDHDSVCKNCTDFQPIPSLLPAFDDKRINAADELSSLSEQAWDDYQDPPYLSEAYSEQGIDDEMLRQLMEFGDDYRSFIGSQSDGRSTPSVISSVPRTRLQSARLHTTDSSVLDSDSDLEDLNHMIEETTKQLQLTERLLRKQRSKDLTLSRQHCNYSEVLATCHTNIECLSAVWKRLASHQRELHQVGVLLKTRWEQVQMEATVQQRQTQQIDHVLQDMKELRNTFAQIASEIENIGQTIKSRLNLESILMKVQSLLQNLDQQKSVLLRVNFRVHSLVNQTGFDGTNLKCEVTQLYQMWDEIHDSGLTKLDCLQTLNTVWDLYEDEIAQVKTALDVDERTLQTMRKVSSQPEQVLLKMPGDKKVQLDLSDIKQQLMSWISIPADDKESGTVHSDALRARLNALLNLSHRLGSAFKNLASCQKEQMSPAWHSIEEEFKDVTLQAQQQQDESNSLLMRLSLMIEMQPSTLRNPCHSEVLRDDDTSSVASACSTKVKTEKPQRTPSFLWRVVKAAIPIQVAVVFLFCMACLMEPHCCDSMNSLNLSLTPQLRYVRGPPPI